MLDTVLFEFDGVVVDAGDAREDALCSALLTEGVVLSAQTYRELCAGHAFDDAARAALGGREGTDEPLIAVIAARAERAYRAYIGKGVTLVDGVRDLIDRLLPVTRLGIVSRSSRQEIALVLSLARVEHAFACVIGAEDAFPPKPSPAPYTAALARLAKRRPPSPGATIVALEDSWQGIRSARAAGIRTIAVGNTPAHVAIEADALLLTLDGATAETLHALATGGGERIP
ncbi:MAG: Phosphoglycolate phosphatase [Gemmatimonadaceae bacterium]|nr:Phosphoglycolate phosphatase [Gemmatimonadaceae bacterium]